MLQPFTRITGIAAPLLRDHVDTDAIIPSREIRQVSKAGLSAGLFAGWRYLDANGRRPNPEFVLNQPAYRGATILLAGDNFGCGSSREHAVWALYEYGIRALLAPSFAPIFFDNCVNNGLLAASIGSAALQSIARAIEPDPASTPLTVDLERCTVSVAAMHELRFEIDADARQRLLAGLDAIDLTLQQLPAIDAFIARDRALRPWVYLGQQAPGEQA
jgi:3-isopropylmalate/(R)-2-methylmalate dehydratase small subunit